MRVAKPPKHDSKWMRFRAILCGALLLGLFAVVLGRAAFVQVLDRSRLSRLQRDQTRRELSFQPRRGLIADRNGEPLAVTRDVDSVFADPSAFDNARYRDSVTDQLSKILQIPRAKILEKLTQEKHFVWIKRKIDEQQAARIRERALDGIELVKEPKRIYPQRELAAHVLGFVGEENGQEGLERELDEVLKGRQQKVQATRDARGAMVLESGAPDPSELTGATVTLTLDSTIQHAAERELDQAVKKAGAVGGWAIVLDVKSGAVLALASNPSFDAGKPGRDPLQWRDRAVQDQLEPGSTIKSFVVARAFEEGVLKPDELLYCEHGVWPHAGRKIHDTHPVDWATPATVLRESSNICAAKIGERLGKEKMIAGLKAFGFGERTNVGLPGEARGALGDPNHMAQIALDTTSFGQGMSATGIQEVAAMAAIANGGVLLAPYIVERIAAPDGTIIEQGGRKEVRRVLSAETARTVTAALEEVVEKGTGTRAALAEYKAAGKTGTAQKVDPIKGGYSEKRLSSFLGFAPADAPKVAILVVIDEPSGKGADVTGGMVAAPAWGNIARESLRQLGVMPEQSKQSAPTEVAQVVADEIPLAASNVVAPAGRAVVPDVAGMPARTAARKLAQASLDADLRGSGRAVSQTPRAGSIVKRGAKVKVTLAPLSERQ
jgi:cell division protein FtsI (penicillin-binding protein 3)